MDKVNGVVWWYQQKIGAYDKQLWEKSVEKTVIKNIEHVPRKLTKVKTDLIDVDLVRGSTFPKTKLKHSLWLLSFRGIWKIIFFPVYIKWWRQQTTSWFGLVLMFLYILQVATLVVYYTDTGKNVSAETLSLAHLLIPVVLMVILGMMHSQMVATGSSHKHRRQQTPERQTTTKKKRKSTKKQDTYHDTDINGHADSEETDKVVKRKKKVVRRKLSNIDEVSDKRNRYKNNVKKQAPETSSGHTEEDPELLGPGFKQSKLVSSSHNIAENSTDALTDNSIKNIALSSGEIKLKKFSAGADCDSHSYGIRNVGFKHSKDSQNSGDNIAKSSVNVDTKVGDVKHRHTQANHLNCEEANVIKKYSDTETVHCDKSIPDKVNATQESDNASTYEDTDDENIKNELLCYKNEDDGSDDVMCPSNEDLSVPMPSGEGVMMMSSSIDDLEVLIPRLSNDANNETDSLQNGEQSEKFGADCNKCDDEKVNEVGLTPGIVKPKKYEAASALKEESAESVVDREIQDMPFMKEGYNENEDTSKLSRGMSEKEDEGLNNIVGSITIVNGNKPGSSSAFEPSNVMGDNLNDIIEDKEISSELEETYKKAEKLLEEKEKSKRAKECNSSFDSDGETTPNTPTPKKSQDLLRRIKSLKSSASFDAQTSEMEWDDPINSGDMSTDSSTQVTTETDITEAEDKDGSKDSDGFGWSENLHHANSVMNNLASSTDKVSCIIWETEEVKKVDLTVLDLGWTIIQKADKTPEKSDYLVLGLAFAVFMSILPVMFRFHQHKDRIDTLCGNITGWFEMGEIIIGENWREKVVVINGVFQRFCISLIFFFLLSVAERTFKQRLLYAKHFCYLTSCRRAKKYDMPHFRLNKVRNIKTWLSLRSYLKKRGPQRSVDTIVSSAFILAVVFLSLMCVELLHDSGGFLDHLGNWELMAWCMALGIYLLRFMTLGTDINKKYRNFSVLITEQINLYLHMEQKPHKKEELMLANNVLKLAEALLKELESPFRISGLSVNPFLYNITKVVILSAFSAVLTELLGFKLKLYKIKLRA